MVVIIFNEEHQEIGPWEETYVGVDDGSAVSHTTEAVQDLKY